MKNNYRKFRDFCNKTILANQETPIDLLPVGKKLVALMDDFAEATKAMHVSRTEAMLDMDAKMREGVPFNRLSEY